MFGPSFFYIVCLCSAAFVQGVVQRRSRCYDFPHNRQDPCDDVYDRKAPIALLTSTAVPLSARKLEITYDDVVEMIFQNNGKTVRGNVTKGTVNCTGGPVFNSKYYLAYATLRNDAVANLTRCGGTHDGLGTAIRHALFFFNYAYPQSEVMKYGDGILGLAFYVGVSGEAPNLQFRSFANVLKNIRGFNETYKTTFIKSTAYLLETLTKDKDFCYYVYPGSVSDPAGRSIPCQIIMEPSWNTRPLISYSQFFGDVLQLKTAVGQLLVSPEPLYGQNNRPLREICSGVEVKCKVL